MERKELNINVNEEGMQIKVHGSTMDIGNFMLNAARGIVHAIQKLEGPESIRKAVSFGFLDEFLTESGIDLDEFKKERKEIYKNEKSKKHEEPTFDLDSELAKLKKKLNDLMKGF